MAADKPEISRPIYQRIDHLLTYLLTEFTYWRKFHFCLRFDLFDSCARYKFSSFIHSFIPVYNLVCFTSILFFYAFDFTCLDLGLSLTVLWCH